MYTCHCLHVSVILVSTAHAANEVLQYLVHAVIRDDERRPLVCKRVIDRGECVDSRTPQLIRRGFQSC